MNDLPLGSPLVPLYVVAGSTVFLLLLWESMLVRNFDHNLDVFTDISRCIFIEQLNRHSLNLYPQQNSKESNVMICQALLPLSNHQQVFIKAPRALLQNPLQLTFKFKSKLEEAIANVHNLEVISHLPT